MEFDFIKCHGSGNRFVMLDAVQHVPAAPDRLARLVCDPDAGGMEADGLLLLVRRADGIFGMRMFNPDGSEAEMCGNGIRCIARLAEARSGLHAFSLFSGGTLYRTERCADIYPGLPTYGVRIPVRLWSADFATHRRGESFIAQPIPELDDTLRFTAISVGNPHIVACVPEGTADDLARLEKLGQRAANLPHLFPNGVNVSFVEMRGRESIFVATCERGAGVTASCGTAMTSSATAAALLGAVPFGAAIDVRNRGGMVRCICRREGEQLETELIGNATFECAGRLAVDERLLAGGGECAPEQKCIKFAVGRGYDGECACYDDFAGTLGGKRI